jgi:hypothetical protein
VNSIKQQNAEEGQGLTIEKTKVIANNIHGIQKPILP